MGNQKTWKIGKSRNSKKEYEIRKGRKSEKVGSCKQ